MSDDERAIRELVHRWMSASKAGDIAAVLDLMTDDVVFMVPAREPFGKDEFKAASEAASGASVNGKSDIQEVRVLDDWAWMRNRREVRITPPAGQPVHRSGYTLTILQKGGDGRWRVARDANLMLFGGG